MNLFKNKKIKIISATSAVLFSLLTCFTGVFSWFSAKSNQITNNGNMPITYDPAVIDMMYSLYKFDKNRKEGYLVDETTTELPFELNQYDTFITERNENNNSLLRRTQSLDSDIIDYSFGKKR